MECFRIARDAGRLEVRLLRTLDSRYTLSNRSESPAIEACIKAVGAGLAGRSRGFSRPAPIVICSSKIAWLEPLAENVSEAPVRSRHRELAELVERVEAAR